MLTKQINFIFIVCILYTLLIQIVSGVDVIQEIDQNSLKFVERLNSGKNLTSIGQLNTRDIFIRTNHEEVVVIDETIRMLKSLKTLQGSYDKENLKNVFQADEFNCTSTLNYNFDERILSMNLTPLNLGINVEGSYILVVIPLNTTTPTRKTRVFSTFTDNQRTAKIQIFEGLDIWPSYNRLLGEVVLDDLVVTPTGVPQIEVTFIIDINNTLHVEVFEKLSGHFTSMNLGNPKERINKERIEMMTSRDFYYKEDEMYLCEYYRAATSFQNYIFVIRNQLAYNGELASRLNVDQKRILEREIKKEFLWLDENYFTYPENFDKERKKLESFVFSVLTKSYRSANNTESMKEHDEL